MNFYATYVKPFTDFLFALLMLLLLAILILPVSLFLQFTNRKIFFVQQRPGKNEKVFRIIKFRTLRDNIAEDDEARQFRLGTILRILHIDELPQAWNILSGDMSFIGPRPLRKEYLPLYNNQQKLRHRVRPGITGLSQIKGGNALSWNHRLRYDAFYAKHISFTLDGYIFFKTITHVFSKKREKHFSEKFEGNG